MTLCSSRSGWSSSDKGSRWKVRISSDRSGPLNSLSARAPWAASSWQGQMPTPLIYHLGINVDSKSSRVVRRIFTRVNLPECKQLLKLNVNRCSTKRDSSKTTCCTTVWMTNNLQPRTSWGKSITPGALTPPILISTKISASKTCFPKITCPNDLVQSRMIKRL